MESNDLQAAIPSQLDYELWRGRGFRHQPGPDTSSHIAAIRIGRIDALYWANARR
jgi:hypothetical protein